ncbi:MAG: SDR family oxidoreductase [Lachnospiraceae bacterium]|nr:SDR family oxidoreductase [Lachnospiraceae bacterium]
MFDVAGKRILVTGSTQGMGKSIAAAFARNGAQVFIHGSREEKTVRVAREVGNGVTPVWADLMEDDCADRMYSKTGNVDVLILNASAQIVEPWDQVSNEHARRQYRIDFESSVNLIQKYAPAMLESHWGRIITISSVQLYVPVSRMLVYGAMKTAQYHMTKNLAEEFAPYGVTVNSIGPGIIDTPRNAKALHDNPEGLAIAVHQIPLGYVGRDCDMNGACLLLASEEGKYITGVNLRIDGGMSL